MTGGGGFVGRWLVDAFDVASERDRGTELHATCRTATGNGSGTARWIPCDLLDEEAARASIAAARPEVLIHAAWHTRPGSYADDGENEAWLAASERLLAAFVAFGGRRFVSLGSCAEYGAHAGPCHESRTPLRPRTAYGTAKARLYERLEKERCAAGLEFAHARLFFLYGPGEKPSRLVPSIIASLRAGKPAETGPGERLRDFMHVRDAGRALARLARSSITGAIHIASGEGVRIADVATCLADCAGRRDLLRVGARAARPEEPDAIVADVTRQTKELAYRPETTLRRGLEDAFAASSPKEVSC